MYSIEKEGECMIKKCPKLQISTQILKGQMNVLPQKININYKKIFSGQRTKINFNREVGGKYTINPPIIKSVMKF